MSNLQALLAKRSDEIEKPPLLPVGQYLASIKSHKFITAKTGTDGLELIWTLISAHESIEPGLLAGIKVAGREVRDTIWLTDDSLWRFMGDAKRNTEGAAQKFGIDVEGKTLLEVISEVDGRQAMLEIVLKPSQDGKNMYANVGGYVKV